MGPDYRPWQADRRSAVRGDPTGAARGGARDRLLGVVAALGLAGLVVYGVYAFVLRAMPPALVEESVRGYLSGRPARPPPPRRIRIRTPLATPD